MRPLVGSSDSYDCTQSCKLAFCQNSLGVALASPSTSIAALGPDAKPSHFHTACRGFH